METICKFLSVEEEIERALLYARLALNALDDPIQYRNLEEIHRYLTESRTSIDKATKLVALLPMKAEGRSRFEWTVLHIDGALRGIEAGLEFSKRPTEAEAF